MSTTGTGTLRVHLGCGRDIKEGWVNVDAVSGPGVDVVADLDHVGREPLPFADDSVDEILGSHLIEHVRDPLAVLQELHRIAKPGGTAVFNVPYGSSDDAFTDPTHVRPYFLDSFGYFSQPNYWRADYGYRGDWQPGYIVLKVDRARYANVPDADVLADVEHLRNIVLEMTVVMLAVKPIRPQERQLQERPQVEIMRVDVPGTSSTDG
jgi:SAM-dependent methyltransferase